MKITLSEKSKAAIEKYNILIMLIVFIVASIIATEGKWLTP